MKAIKALRALGPIDAKNIWRDSLLSLMIFTPVLIGVVLRWLVPWISTLLRQELGFDLPPYYPLLMSLIVISMPIYFGFVIGFLLLDHRDDQTLMALQVTPLTLKGYLIYRISVPMLISIIATMIVHPVGGLVSMPPFNVLLTAIASAPLAPSFALFLAAFADNKVKGFALAKGSGVIFVPAVLAYFVTSNWQLAFGVFPTYWMIKLYWVLHNGEAHAWFYFLVALVYQAVMLLVLMHRFNRVTTGR